MTTIRIVFTVFAICISFLFPYWIFLLLLLVGALLFRNFWEAIAITVVVNSVYVYSGANFQAVYVVWGLVVYLISLIFYSQTRFYSELFKKKNT